MTDVFSLTTSASWRKLKRLSEETEQAKELGPNSAPLHAISYLSLPPYSTEDGSHHIAELANENGLAACNLALYRASLLFTYKHITDTDFQRAQEECGHAVWYLRAGLRLLRLTTEQDQHDTTKRVRGFVNSMASQAELQQARTKHRISDRLTFVLGMHRSGTSAITGMLAKAGFAAPSDQMPANIVNPKGFWESLSIVKLNEDFLAEMESHWSSSLPLPEGWSESINARKWRTSLINIISEIYGGGEPPAIKDPRFCTLIPGLEPWLEASLVESSFIIPIRRPLEVYNSLREAQGTDLYRALRLWIHSIHMAEKTTRSHIRTFINFDTLIEDPCNTLAACLKAVKPNPDRRNTGGMPNSDHEGRPEGLDRAAEFVDKSLKRQRGEITEKDFSETGSARDAKLINLADEIYQAILANMPDDESISRALDKLEPRIEQALTS